MTDPVEDQLPLYREWAVDWEQGCFALQNGRMYTVSGTEALKIWVYCALHPDSCRFLFSAHTPDYGNQLAHRIGFAGSPELLESLLRHEIEETLLVSPYIQKVDGFSFSRQGSLIRISCRVHTIYDDFTSETEMQTP